MIIKALAVILWAIAICTVSIVAIMVVYVLKQARWEANLKRYRIGQLGVINPQGHMITTPEELLKELQGIEERIAK